MSQTPSEDERPSPPTQQTWDPSLYDQRHSFVYKVAEDLLGLLAPQRGERIVDLGCGTGPLTAKIAEAGAKVIGLDASAEMIRQAQAKFNQIDFRVADATRFSIEQPQDAVFSNAVLHWVKPPEAAAGAIARALKPGGRLVAEFGGRGCMAGVIAAVNDSLGVTDRGKKPWFFPSVAEYTAILERQGFEIRMATLFDRPTTLEEGERGLANWLCMFGASFLSGLDEQRREQLYADVAERLRPQMWHGDHWVVDYRRLRLMAIKL